MRRRTQGREYAEGNYFNLFYHYYMCTYRHIDCVWLSYAHRQQAAERSGVAGCGGNEAMRLTLACCGTLVLKGAMLGAAAGRAEAKAVPRFRANCLRAGLSIEYFVYPSYLMDNQQNQVYTRQNL